MKGAELIAQAEMSPCIGVCILDEDSGWCFGCGRTDREIEEWQSLSDDLRAHLESELPGRVKTLLDKRRAQRGAKRGSRRIRRER